MDSDDSMDSPPLTVQYGRRIMTPDGVDDDQTLSSRYPVSIISTLNLPPAASPTSPLVPPSVPRSMAGNKSTADGWSIPPPPPVPDSPLQPAKQNLSMMTSITTVSIEAETSTLLRSRVSVDSFKNIPGNAVDARKKGQLDSDIDTDYDTETEATHSTDDLPAIQPSYVSMTTTTISHIQSTSVPTSTLASSSSASTAPSAAGPLSIITSQLTRNTSTASTASFLSTRSRSF
ncbi:hypothetical protein BGZ65_011863, partial [Modicella reniformis]